MAEKNHTILTEFFFITFTEHPELGLPLFLFFLGLYVITLLGNSGMVFLICTDSKLSTPMYFFLSHLASVDICYSSAITPQVLAILLKQGLVVSYECCAAQFFFSTFLGATDCYLLAAMAYDRYVAVCQPLLHMTIMTKKTCVVLAAASYAAALFAATVRTAAAFTLSFCGDNQIDFVFCDLPPLLKLTCGDSSTQELVIVVFAIFVIPACMVVILVSYLFIFRAILLIPSAGGRAKTFSTCASHIMAVSLFFGTLIFMYVRSNEGNSLQEDRIVSMMYTIIIPMLNPLIYSLRNKEVKEAMRKALRNAKFFRRDLG
ncbi:olfactory receptor 9Q2-like [Antechinus flavipes]|uniref:olfactory receptor 9Q2-like n=1 Tax=Antechinus flavipes TaxID=38775 RepID=UPI00223561AD|nr:olfactory receptor 9Q2-like [Antechinus flavipes]